MCKSKKAIQYFRLGEQYAETAKLLLETLICNGNSNAGIGKTPEEATQQMEQNAAKSDLYLLIPAIFNCLQSTELLIKGLLLLSHKSIKRQHGVEELLDIVKVSYTEDSEIYKRLFSFYECQIGIIAAYKQANGIKTSHDLYMSLRYPEIALQPEKGKKKGKVITVDYTNLMYNGDVGIKQFKVLKESLEAVKLATVKEYRSKTNR